MQLSSSTSRLVRTLLCAGQFLRWHLGWFSALWVTPLLCIFAVAALRVGIYRAGYSICSYIVSGVLYGGVITLILFAPDATITARRRRRREAKQHITISESRPWSLGRFIKAILLTIGKFCYGYFKPFFMRDFMFAWLSTGFYYTGTLSLTNFMQYYYTVSDSVDI